MLSRSNRSLTVCLNAQINRAKIRLFSRISVNKTIILQKGKNFEFYIISYRVLNYSTISIFISYFTMLLFKEFTFDSAHFLPHVPEGHKCREMHGHTYRLKVWIEDQLDPQLAWVMDFADLKAIVKTVVDEIDHKCLNNVAGLDNPTCEMIAVWIWDRLKPMLPRMARIELHETPTSGVIYDGN